MKVRFLLTTLAISLCGCTPGFGVTVSPSSTTQNSKTTTIVNNTTNNTTNNVTNNGASASPAPSTASPATSQQSTAPASVPSTTGTGSSTPQPSLSGGDGQLPTERPDTTYVASLNGNNVIPVQLTAATGTAKATLSNQWTTLTINVTVNGLKGGFGDEDFDFLTLISADKAKLPNINIDLGGQKLANGKQLVFQFTTDTLGNYRDVLNALNGGNLAVIAAGNASIQGTFAKP